MLWAPEAPIVLPVMWFVAKVLIGNADIGPHKVLLRVVDGNGDTVLSPLEGQLEVPAPPPELAGEPMDLPILLGVVNATFPDFDTYTFELRIDERVVAEARLHVRQRPNP